MDDCVPLDDTEVWFTPRTADKVYRGIYRENLGKESGIIGDAGFFPEDKIVAWMYVEEPEPYKQSK